MRLTIEAYVERLDVRCGDCGYRFSIVDPRRKEVEEPTLLRGTRCPNCDARAAVVSDWRR